MYSVREGYNSPAFSQRHAVMSGKYHVPAVRVTLVCPYAANIFQRTCPSWNSPALTGRLAMITPQEARQRTRTLVEHMSTSVNAATSPM